MKQKIFGISAVAVLVIVGLLVSDHITSAQRPDRNTQPGQGQGQRGQRGGGERGSTDIMRMFTQGSFVNNTWLDLSFKVKISDESLMKARPIHQAAHDKFTKKIEEILASGDFQSARQEMTTFSQDVIKELQTGLKEILTKEEMNKLTMLMKERLEAEQERRNRFRGGQQGGGGQGQGGQRGQRPTQ